MESRTVAPYRAPGDDRNRNGAVETVLNDFLRRVPLLSGDGLDRAKQDFLETVKRLNSQISSGGQKGLPPYRQRIGALVTDQPARAIGIALGLGIILGARCFIGRHPTSSR